LAVALTAVGAPGTAPSVTGLDAGDDVPAPMTLVAVTVKVYAVPRVSPAIVVEAAAGDPVTVSPLQLPQTGAGVTV
jgi:hypothetical protein